MTPGRAPHRNPLPAPAGFERMANATDLYYRWEAASGGAPLLGTETLAIKVFNGGYDLTQVRLAVRGEDDAARELVTVELESEHWPRGSEMQFEVPSYELPEPVHRVAVELVRADFDRGPFGI